MSLAVGVSSSSPLAALESVRVVGMRSDSRARERFLHLFLDGGIGRCRAHRSGLLHFFWWSCLDRLAALRVARLVCVQKLREIFHPLLIRFGLDVNLCRLRRLLEESEDGFPAKRLEPRFSPRRAA